MDEQFSEIKAGYLVIEEDTIVELAPMTTLDEKRMAANQVIDGQNGILMPGMINTHTHVGMIPFRSLETMCQIDSGVFFSIRTIHDKRISRMQ